MTTLTDTQVITASGGLVELGYVAFSGGTINGTTGDAGASSFATPITISFVSDGSPILLEVSAIDQNTGANPSGSESYVVVFLDNVFQRRITRVQTSGTITESQSCNAFLRMTAAAGAHTVELKQFRVNANGNLNAGYARVSKIVSATQWPAVTTGSIICTSSTRPASPFVGQQIYETDTSKVFVWTGAAWSQVATQNAPIAGSVVQMRSGFTQTEVQTTASRVDTGIAATITPRFSNSTILIQAQISTRRHGSNVGIGFDIRRNGTVVLNHFHNYYIYNSADVSGGNPVPLFFVDSPASTSALEYRIFFGSYSGTTVDVQDDSVYRSYIILWEIAA